jgi:hypothetical protein
VGSFDKFITKIKRAETPPYRLLKRVILALKTPSGPRIPDFVKPVGKLFYHFHYFVIATVRKILALCYYHPLFQSRCQTVGKHLRLEGMPYVDGPVELHLGDDVMFGGNVALLSGRVLGRPRLVIKDRSAIGWNSSILLNREVLIDEDVIIAPGCRISDTDGHPRDAIQRAQNVPPTANDIKPVHICRYAWVGAGTHVMKGVTIGEGAIIGANSVVVSDIPPYSIALGNPAEVFFRNIAKKSRTGD